MSRRRLPARAVALSRAPALALLAALACACGRSEPPAAPTSEGWHEFEGSWSAAGRRRELHLGPERRVAVLEVSGSLLLSGPSRPAEGFRGEAITFSDERTGLTGRAVWTDEHGDQVYSELRLESLRPDEPILGTFVGGSGRFAGATGEYEFRWQFLIESDDGVVHGRALGLHGRVRVDAGGGGGER